MRERETVQYHEDFNKPLLIFIAVEKLREIATFRELILTSALGVRIGKYPEIENFVTPSL